MFATIVFDFVDLIVQLSDFALYDGSNRSSPGMHTLLEEVDLMRVESSLILVTGRLIVWSALTDNCSRSLGTRWGRLKLKEDLQSLQSIGSEALRDAKCKKCCAVGTVKADWFQPIRHRAGELKRDLVKNLTENLTTFINTCKYAL